MDELHDRFHRLDRIAAPNLWNEAVGRAAELDAAPRRAFNPAIVLIAGALLVAALAGTIAVGGWVNRPQTDFLTTVYSNGVIAVVGQCGRIVGIDPETSVARDLVSRSDDPCDEVFDFAWSSDGRWLAYFVTPEAADGCCQASEVWVRDTHNGSETLVQSCDGCHALDISPDGSLVSYVEWAPEQSGRALVVARADGSAVYRAPFVGAPGDLEFSPDGKTVAIPLTGGTSGIHVLDVASLDESATPAMRLLHGPVAAGKVSWSPDGQWLAFDKEAGGGWLEIWAARTDGTDARMLATSRPPNVPSYPTWSADSSTVAYVSAATGDLELWTASLDGEPNLVHRSPCCLWDFVPPVWSPDGEWIAFGISTSENDPESGLYLVRPDGRDLHRLSTFAGPPAWQPLVDEP